jgi:SAM-dependent methyltransferase
MQYDPIKKSLGVVFNSTPWLRVLFYRLLDLLLLRSWYIRRELRVWRKRVADNASILDAGSGFGQYVWRLSRMGSLFRILGVDVKPEQIDDCNNFFARMNLSDRVSFREADLTTFDAKDVYDLVLSVDVMEHIVEDEKVLTNLCRSLHVGGMLLISTPSDQGGSDTDHHHSSEGISGFIDEHVRDGYNINDIREKLLRAGFSTVEARYTYGVPGSIAWRLSMKYPIVMLNVSKLFFVVLPFYYLIAYPVAYVLNHFDVWGNHAKGTGLLVKAIK